MGFFSDRLTQYSLHHTFNKTDDVCRLTQAGAGAGALDDGVFAGVVEDRALGQGDVRRHPRDGYPETAQTSQRAHRLNRERECYTRGAAEARSYLPSNLCFRKSKSAFCIMSVTWRRRARHETTTDNGSEIRFIYIYIYIYQTVLSPRSL